MPRLKLRPKLKTKVVTEEKKSVDRVEARNINHDEEGYPYLEFYDPMIMKIYRVDRYSINLHYPISRNENGETEYGCELLFYPSKFGMEQIESYASEDAMYVNAGTAERLIRRLKQLRDWGNPHWRIDVDFPVTHDNWLSLNKPAETKVKRVKLKTKVERVRLKVKSETKPKRKKLKLRTK